MKTAEQWFSELTDGSNSDCALISIEEIESIQHDARQSAFKEAAEVVKREADVTKRCCSDAGVAGIECLEVTLYPAILAHAAKEVV